MLVESKAGGNFEPDPILDVEANVEARVIGIIHAGKHEKQKHDGTKFIDEYKTIEQAIIEFEIVEDGTQVERGAEGNKTLVNRRMCKFVNYSSHENSEMFAIAKAANPKSAWTEGKDGFVQTGMFIGKPVSLELGTNKDGTKNTIKKVHAIPPKYQDSVPALTIKPFQFSVMGGAFPLEDGTETTINDVPVWMLSLALDKAVDAEQFKQVDEMEATIAAAKAAKDNKGTDTELEGDRLPAKTEEKVEPEVEPEAEPEKVEEKPKARTRTRSRAAKVDYTTKSIEDLEAIALEKGAVTDEDLDDLNDTITDDEEYKAAIIAKIEA